MVKSLQGGIGSVQSCKVVARWAKVGSIMVKSLQGGIVVGSIMVKSLQGGLRWVQSW